MTGKHKPKKRKIMIHAAICSAVAKRYTPLNSRFETAITYVQEHWAELCDTASDGRRELEGDSLYVMIGHFGLKAAADARLEAHDRYIDIQVILSGSECFGWSQRTACNLPDGVIDTERDIIFFADAPTSTVTARAGEMVIFFPEDAHAPLISPDGGPAQVRKAIVKVLAL